MLLVVAIVILGAGVCLGVGTKRSRTSQNGRRFEPIRGPLQGLVEPVASLPPVLLPARPRAEDVDSVNFALGLRGYRCDQDDEVRDALLAEISRLHEVLAANGKAPVLSNTSHSSE